jgi:erythromycin esterase
MPNEIASDALPLSDGADLEPLLDRLARARVVMLGEASHGTHEYYAWRALITERLLDRGGRWFVAVEGDWPDCFRVNQAVRGMPGPPDDPAEALAGFERWPTWMWANTDVLWFLRNLRRRNVELPAEERTGFYGLDVYSLWDSLRALLGHLHRYHPQHTEAAIRALRCFEPYAEDPQRYGFATHALAPASCQTELVQLLATMRREAAPDESEDPELHLDAVQNAHVAANAERYYRTMVQGGAASWNIRDRHMMSTLERLLDHHQGSRAIVWAHNTHIGDARATDMASAGMVNIGQLARERFGDGDVALVGFAGFRGEVIAAREWGADHEVMTVPPARDGSAEAMMASAGLDRALFLFGRPPATGSWEHRALDHRAIGVVYRPEFERFGNYVPSRLGHRYDALLYFTDTEALEPLRPEPAFATELETAPSGV